MKTVLCIRNDPDDSLGIIPAVFAEQSVPLVRLDAFSDGVRWPDVDQIGGLIVFGGEMNVDEVDRHPFLLTQRQLLRRAVDAGLPVLGICLGAQMLARALDARVYRAAVREFGFRPVTVTAAGQADELLAEFASGDRVFQWHEDTFDLPNGAVLLATGEEVAMQAFRVGQHAWGIQFHFEIDLPGVEAWLKMAEPTLTPVWGRSAEHIREELAKHLEAQQQRSRRLLEAFARTVT
ncbi:MAG: gamma-glutamyl-gamma-aminobutyrate hydrolase family protein [Candidatus Dormibacteraeota bacterium]|nr:gamma-glutamyl-gamma-aminobutyrate hydrolase family protein [Candidatus Dormibacteraeota bacterium]